MADAIDAARAVLQGRIEEIEAEAGKLGAALESLGAGAAPAARPGLKPKRRGRRAAKRAPRGQRREEFLAAVKASPGASAAELGKAIGISTNQAYALGQRLLKDDEVKKKGKGYRSA